MDVGIGETLLRYLNELVHKLVILLSSGSVLSKTQIEIVVEKIFVLETFSRAGHVGFFLFR